MGSVFNDCNRATLFNCIGWLIVITEPKEKSCLEYLGGNLEVKYEKVYVDSMLVRTDIIIEFKK